jgi:hypothetical protein
VRDSNPPSACNIEIHFQAKTRGNAPNSSTANADKFSELPSNAKDLAHEHAHEGSNEISAKNLNISAFLELAEHSQLKWGNRLTTQFELNRHPDGPSCA